MLKNKEPYNIMTYTVAGVPLTSIINVIKEDNPTYEFIYISGNHLYFSTTNIFDNRIQMTDSYGFGLIKFSLEKYIRDYEIKKILK